MWRIWKYNRKQSTGRIAGSGCGSSRPRQTADPIPQVPVSVFLSSRHHHSGLAGASGVLP